jgi:ABC-type multidrug transport system ATPase subunit
MMIFSLVPVVVQRLPRMFMYASQLVGARINLQLSETSLKRLLEYESHDPQSRCSSDQVVLDAATDVVPATVVADVATSGVTFRYPTPDGGWQGGVVDVTTVFRAGQWTSVMGGAGSGKSTLLKLLLGRLQPQAGQAAYGQVPLASLSVPQSARVFSLMPQSLALLDATIEQNLLFARLPAESGLDDADLDVLEALGLGALCRQKALDMLAGEVPWPAEPGVIRKHVREKLSQAGILSDGAYENGHSDPTHWALEVLLRGRCDRDRALGVLLGKAARNDLKEWSSSNLGRQVAQAGMEVLSQGRRLLSVPNYAEYVRLTPAPLDERIWRFRAEHVELLDRSDLGSSDRLSLVRIALTCTGAERPGHLSAPAWSQQELSAEVDRLRRLLGPILQPFHIDRVHPYLTWRENLVFAAVDSRNSRTSRLADQAILAAADEMGLSRYLLRTGLSYPIGRLGSRLSGGQGQLVGLCRAVLRRTPVLVLDEPTSALDPASRSRVADFLRQWRSGRVIITVSHDPEFIRQADKVLVLEAGRWAASGTFGELERTSEAFRMILRKP